MVILHDAIKTIENGVFVLFFEEKKPVLFQKKTKPPGLKKTKVGVFKKTRIFRKPGYLSIFLCDFPLIARSGHHHQFDWVRGTHLERSSLVLKKLRITGIWICEN